MPNGAFAIEEGRILFEFASISGSTDIQRKRFYHRRTSP